MLGLEDASLNPYQRFNVYRQILRHVILLVSFVPFYLHAAIQIPVGEQNAPKLFFKHILPEQVASIGYISSIAQDTQGFMWFGGANGLARYDGYELTVFRHEDTDPASISHSSINHIVMARDGSLWVATRNGLNLFDSRLLTFKRINVSPDASTNEITWVHEDSKGGMWLGTRGGLFSFDRAKNRLTKIEDNTLVTSAESTPVVWSVVDDRNGNIWIAYQSYGVSRYDPKTGTFEHFMRTADQPNAHGFNDTRRLYIDPENNIMAATYGDGLHKFDVEQNQFIKVNHDSTEKGATVWSTLVDRQNNLWVGDGSHVHFQPGQRGPFYRYFFNDMDSSSPGNYVVNEIFEDRAGDIWLGYFPSGVDVVDRQASAFHNYVHSALNPNSITDGGVSSVAEDSSGNLWIGTGYGLNYFNRNTRENTRYTYDAANPKGLSGSTILSIAISSGENLWLGIWSGGLNSFNRTTQEVTRYLPDANKPHALRGREAWSVIEDHQKNVWVATEEGLNRFDQHTQTFEYILPPAELRDGDKVLYSRVVYEDKQHNLWLGTTRGLFLFDRATKTFTRYKHSTFDETSISADFVLVVYEDKRGNLWVGTDGGGLNLMDRRIGKFTAFTTSDGLADNVVGGITEDENGNLWLGTQKGIAKFDPEKRSFNNYDKHHGLADNLFNRNASLYTRYGELLMGNSKGFSLFKTGDIKNNSYAPNIVITNLQVNNKTVAVGKNSPLTKAIETTSSLTLGYKDRVFTLEFAALSFHHVEDNQYAYRLLGFEENWSHVGTKRNATYTNLSPGTYVFEVKGSNNDGVWSLYPASLQIIILPPWWRTWWAYSLYVFLLVALVFWIFHVQRLKLSFQAEKLRQERILVKRLTQIDKLKDEFLANTSQELRTPLNGIIDLAESLRDGVAGDISPKVKYHLSLIVDSGKRLASLVNDILDFSQLKNKGITLNRKAIDIQVLVDIVLNLSKPLIAEKAVVFANNIPKNLPPAYADEDRILQVLHNLISNAAKFTDRGVINVSAAVVNDFLQVEVSDTGTGIPADRVSEIFESFTQSDGNLEHGQGGAALGLSVTKQLIELHGGTIRVESVLGIGSTFYFTLPVSYDLPDAISTKHKNLESPVKDASYYAADVGQEPAQQHQSNILIVDDDLVNRRILANYLAMGGYNIIEANCAEEAFAIVATQVIDLVLLDTMMPRISGYETCKTLRETYPAHELPIILLTARSQINDLVMGFEAGANDFMVKPITKEVLLVRVATHLQLHDVTRNLDKKVAERTEELNQSNAVLQRAQKELEVAYQKLEEASLTDPLTGLHNRRFLAKSIAADTAIVERNYADWAASQTNLSTPLTQPNEQDLMFMLLDLDLFKSVNDTYGHSAGDKLLEQLSQLLKATLRESDYLVRWGGEEFLIVVRFCNREEVPELAERIRQTVEAFGFDIGNGQTIRKTCSIGMAAYPFYRTKPMLMTWEQVIDTADRALYLAKHNGRNCWVNVVAANHDDKEWVNPAASDSLVSLAAAGIINIESSTGV